MNFKPAWALMVAAALFATVAQAKGHKSTHYPGAHHSGSHGGGYKGGHGSSHKGGTYHNTRTSNRYGQHGSKRHAKRSK